MKCPTCGEHTPDGWQWLLVKRMVTSSQQVPREVSVRDFDEAASILDRSPRMSAVLSRRILADLLEEYAQRAQYNLADRIDSFNEDTTHPRRLRENLHYLREIADLSAHTKKNDQAAIVEVETAEAEWTLEVVERLLDYFIVSAAKDKAVRDEVDQKLKDTGRKPIKPLPEDRR